MLKNNDFGNDTDDQRTDRADLMSENIDDLAPVIGVEGSLLDWAQNVSSNWASARVTADTEGGQDDVAYQLYHEKFDEATKTYAENKELLIAIIGDLKKNDEIVEEYQIKGRIPITRGGLKTAIEDWKKTHDALTAAGDARVIPDPLVTEMVILKDEFDNLWRAAIREKDEAVDATKAKEDLFREDCDKFRIVFRLAKIALGPDNSDLRLLGFVPSSEIWTPGQPDPELPVYPNPPETFTLSLRADGTIEVVWTGVAGATHMLLEKRKQGEIDWSLVMNGLPADPAEILPYIDPYISPGIWEYRMIPMNGDEHGMEIVAVIEVPEG